jgi:hypothetical protein
MHCTDRDASIAAKPPPYPRLLAPENRAESGTKSAPIRAESVPPRLRFPLRRIRAATPELCLWDKIRANPRRIRANPARNPRTAFSAPEV